jgi:hypothetical protein
MTSAQTTRNIFAARKLAQARVRKTIAGDKPKEQSEKREGVRKP